MQDALNVKKIIYDDVNECGDGCFVYEDMSNRIVIEYSDECGELGGIVRISKEAFK